MHMRINYVIAALEGHARMLYGFERGSFNFKGAWFEDIMNNDIHDFSR